eukprot:CAMPEP_0115546142 /NCGR_PEP_ID=MMETSP0271-20121206/92974_1 /TAXON_ID=71861 /ORGANISM="Scrippsiella trochoidea, Strain CCMP3099" /LENGTH=80 /DNA_ID=CAMNT_0002979525 /DNA_START=39 /DNA_END=278 /DNA_ORIENTATION=-
MTASCRLNSPAATLAAMEIHACTEPPWIRGCTPGGMSIVVSSLWVYPSTPPNSSMTFWHVACIALAISSLNPCDSTPAAS